VKTDLLGAWAFAPDDLYAIGDAGVILHSMGDGTWQQQPSGVNGRIGGIWAASPSDVYAVGVSGTVLHSTGSESYVTTPMRDGSASAADQGVPNECASGQTMCPTGCVDLANDLNNCGGCGNACAKGQICDGLCVGGVGGVDLAVPVDMSVPTDMSVGCTAGQISVGMPIISFDTDGTFVYVVAGGGSNWVLGKVPVCGGSLTPYPVISQMLQTPGSLAVAGNNIYVINNAGATSLDAGSNGMQVIYMLTDGTLINTGGGLGTFQANPQTALFINNSYRVHWLGQSGLYRWDGSSAAQQLDSQTGDPRALVGTANDIIYFTDGTQVYGWFGVAPSTMVASGTIVRGLGADANAATPFWFADESTGIVYSACDVTGCGFPTQQQIGTISGAAGYMTTDAVNLYIATYSGSNDSLWKMPVAGGTAQSWMTGLTAPTVLRLDANFVYVLDQGVVKRTPK
jgi:hypothetical protein